MKEKSWFIILVIMFYIILTGIDRFVCKIPDYIYSNSDNLNYINNNCKNK